MLNEIKKDAQARMGKSIESLRHGLVKVRTGRASTGLVDSIKVVAYGSEVPLSQVASVAVADARSLVITPWDKGMVGAVERGIRESNLGLNPIIDGQNLRIPLPELNEERRKSLVKVAHDYAEKAKVAIRHVRRDGMDDLKKAEKDGDIGQDLSRSQSEKVQKMTDDVILDVDRLLAEKEKEIMQV